jgi:hypothetical protein
MSEEPAAPEIVDFNQWFDATLRKPDGEPYSERQKRAIAKRYSLPVIKVGWVPKIDPAAANRRLAELARKPSEQPQRRGPGRPRKYQNGD